MRASKRRPSHRTTCAASDRTTCALVRIRPSRFHTMPEPDPLPPSTRTCAVDRRSRSAISPNPCMSPPGGPFPDGDRNPLERTSPKQSGFDLLSRRVGFEGALNLVRIGYLFSRERDQDVADQHPRLGGWTLAFER